ncbi:MAG: hypothetical protein IMY73_00135 [Bacteroidetes bacterium]|nr:hypothetical protein [Bacteroidota bacterium]
MKNILYLAVLLLLPFTVIGCNNNDDYQTEYISLGSVDRETTGDFLLKLDDGELVRPLSFNSDAENGKRILMTFVYENDYAESAVIDHDVRLTGFSWVLTKDIIDLTNDNKDEVGNDPFVGIEGIDTGGGYINVYFCFLADYEQHLINMVENKIEDSSSTSTDEINLEFRQNAHGETAGYEYLGLASFPIKKYIDKAVGKDKITFNIKVKLYNGQENNIKVSYNIKSPEKSIVSQGENKYINSSHFK